jgi:transcription-repair coupling factor (superfamily II helicase)
MNGQKLLTPDLFLQWFSKTLNLKFLNYDGLHITALSLFILSCFKNNNQALLVLLEDEASSKALYEFCCCFYPDFIYYFPKTQKSVSHIQGFVPEYKRYQTESYYALSVKKPRLFICSLSGVYEKLFPAGQNNFNGFLLKEKTKISRDSLVRVLNKWGYNKTKKLFVLKHIRFVAALLMSFP